jgi:hypothetical protein
MGVVLPFETQATKHTNVRRGATHELDTTGAELALMAAVRDGCDRRGILTAARPLLERLRLVRGSLVFPSKHSCFQWGGVHILHPVTHTGQKRAGPWPT